MTFLNQFLIKKAQRVTYLFLPFSLWYWVGQSLQTHAVGVNNIWQY